MSRKIDINLDNPIIQAGSIAKGAVENLKNEFSDASKQYIDNEMIDGGIIQIVTAGYGSNHDGDKFIIAICDDCIQSNLDDGTLLLFKSGSYVTPEEDLEKSKKIYKRRKRLDDLISEE